MTMQGEGCASEPVVQHPWQGSACPLHLTTYHFGSSLTAAYASFSWLVEHHGPFATLQLVLTLCPAFLAPDHPVLLAVAVSAHASTTVPCGKRAHCPTGFRHHCLPWWKTPDGTGGNSYKPPFAIVLQLMTMLPSHNSGLFGLCLSLYPHNSSPNFT